MCRPFRRSRPAEGPVPAGSALEKSPATEYHEVPNDGVGLTGRLHMAQSLPVLNLSEAAYECTFGRGCDGVCCRNGRPGVYPDEVERLRDNLARFLPELRPSARALVERRGPLSGRRRHGLPLLRVVDGWCVFFNEGCVLHKVGAREGDKYRYK